MEILNKVCVVCGKPFSVKSQWKVKICCGKECAAIRKKSMQSGKEYQKWRYEIEKAKKKPQERFCGICGKPLDEETRRRYHEKCVVDFALADMLVNPWCINKSLACKRAMNYGYTTEDLKEMLIKRLKEINGGRTNGNELE